MRKRHPAAWSTLCCCSSLLAACGADPAPLPVEDLGPLRLIGQRALAPKTSYAGTVVGGLSGVDYDAANDQYYALCDDRSDLSPARLYRLRLRFDGSSVQPIEFLGTEVLRQPDGSPYPNKAAMDGKVPDPESLRLSGPGTLLWTSEGDRTLLIDPFVREIRADGSHVSEVPLPARYHMAMEERGPRHNGVFEGLTSLGGRALVAVEEPLYEDGPRASPQSGGVVRFWTFDRQSRAPGPEYAYPLDPIPRPPMPADAFAVNGVSEVLGISETRLLVLERAFATGVGHSARLYEVDTREASDVSGLARLAGAAYTPLQKRLVLDFATLGFPIDNLEGLTFGPRLPSGNRSLVVLSDDNFSDAQVTQLLVFEVLPPAP